MGFETPKISSIEKVKKLAKKGILMAGLGTVLLSTEGCSDDEKGSKMPPKGPDPIVEKSSAVKPEHKFLNADEVKAREKVADEVVIDYLEKLSNNSASGNRMEMGDNGNIFIEIHGSFFELTKTDLARLQSLVLNSELPPNSSTLVRSTSAKALAIKIDLDITAHAKKVTDSSVLPAQIKAHYNDLQKIGLTK
ncbi:MAG: hypothetical protein WCI76_01250 [bacterium]